MSAIITQAIVFEDSGASLMSRVVQGDGTNITQAAITSITCNVYNVSTEALIATPTVVVATSVFDTLQTSDPRWTADKIGFNFLHVMPASVFVDGNRVYQAEYKFSPVSGEVFHVVFKITTIPLLGS